jgi:pullulanase-type alpha-1,6-glucosidase
MRRHAPLSYLVKGLLIIAVIALSVVPLSTFPSFSSLSTLTVAPVNAAPKFAGNPTTVTVAGSLQSELGCPGDWQPDCVATHADYIQEDDVWQKTFNVPAGGYEYKVAVNDSWSENYGRFAAPGGGNIALNLGAATDVKFYFDYKTKWVADNQNYRIVTAPGNFQSELGCPGDWSPDCLRSWLTDPDEDGTFTFVTGNLPAGSYEAKAAINESWSENYGAGGAPGGANIPFTVSNTGDPVLFSFVSATNVLTITSPFIPTRTARVAGSLQSELGCPGDWQPDCDATQIAYDPSDLIYAGTFNVPAGNYEYKVAINGSWTENYGQNAVPNGGNIPLNLGAATDVKFYYSDVTHWVTSNKNARIVTAAGSFQSELGCPGDWQPDCLRSWLQDPEGDGLYTFQTSLLPAGSYEAKAALFEGWSENYGEGGVPGGSNIAFTVATAGTTVFFSFDTNTNILTISTAGAPVGDLAKRKAHWVTKDTIAWATSATAADTVKLHYDPNGTLALDATGVIGGSAITMTLDPAGLPQSVKDKFPHLAALKAFKIGSGDLSLVPDILKAQIAVSAVNAAATPLDATGVQLPGVLDDVYPYTGPLGITFNSAPTIRVWAPTARSVKLHRFADANPATVSTVHPMTFDALTGVWSVVGEASWVGQYYQFEVEVYVHGTKLVEKNFVTDPYSFGLSQNATRSLVLDLNDPSAKPAGWDSLGKPALNAPEDIVLYELHVRDFSAFDTTVTPAWRGTYKAFTEVNSNGVKHLRALAQSGLTHIHLLPAFDIASVNEDKSTWQEPDYSALASYAPDSDQQQAAISPLRDKDGFNWGYDPVHYGVPDGSYSTDAGGSTRVIEFREMVAALNKMGLRVVMDVVYNHTSSSGQNPNSVLDKIVPGYYHRLNGEGNIERSTCCENTATEHNMMEKLMVDTLRTWATKYKVDGFRFDLMGHHMKRNMLAVRSMLDSLTVGADGVDGRSIYLYGEAWNFGEVASNARGENAIQVNMRGTGIGSFNDRIRDGIRGGGPFSGLQEQGFSTGLFYDPNAIPQGSSADQLERLKAQTDWIKASMAGALRDYQLVDRTGATVYAYQIDYNGQQTGYTGDPQEIINYADAHDNETLWDAVQMKAASANTVADRVRASNIAIDVVMLSQGVPLFHAGVDVLRSKSLDRNSYNAGDWFNRVDWSYQTNNWGVGLPAQGENGTHWPIMGPLLANPAYRATPADIMASVMHFREMLQVRKSSELFRMRTAGEIIAQLKFYNNGPTQLPGLIAFSVAKGGTASAASVSAASSLSSATELVFVVINANSARQSFGGAEFIGLPLDLHPVLKSSFDPTARTSSYDRTTGLFSVPGRTTAVFSFNLQPGPGGIGGTATGGTAGGPTALPATGHAPTTAPEPMPMLPMLVGALAAFVALVKTTLIRRGRKSHSVPRVTCISVSPSVANYQTAIPRLWDRCFRCHEPSVCA